MWYRAANRQGERVILKTMASRAGASICAARNQKQASACDHGSDFCKEQHSIARVSLLAAFLVFSDLGEWCMLFIFRPIRRRSRPSPARGPFQPSAPLFGLGIDCRYCHSSVETSRSRHSSNSHLHERHSQVWTVPQKRSGMQFAFVYQHGH